MRLHELLSVYRASPDVRITLRFEGFIKNDDGSRDWFSEELIECEPYGDISLFSISSYLDYYVHYIYETNNPDIPTVFVVNEDPENEF